MSPKHHARVLNCTTGLIGDCAFDVVVCRWRHHLQVAGWIAFAFVVITDAVLSFMVQALPWFYLLYAIDAQSYVDPHSGENAFGLALEAAADWDLVKILTIFTILCTYLPDIMYILLHLVFKWVMIGTLLLLNTVQILERRWVAGNQVHVSTE